jgi:glycosyltransferase involved in cell wall biosynthesis
MNVALITFTNQEIGGVETVNRHILSFFEGRGDTVTVFSRETLKINKGRTVADKALYKLFGPCYFFRGHFKNREILEKFDLVICNGEYGWGVKHRHAIVIYHGCWWGFLLNCYKALKWYQIIKLLINTWIQYRASQGKYVIAVSGDTKRYLEKSRVKVDEVVENCMEIGDFPGSTAKNRDLISVVSWDHYGKGVDILQQIAAEGYSVDVLGVSDIPGLNCLGWVPNKDLKQIMANYKIFILPSRYEGLSMSVLEAMSLGLPVLTSRAGNGLDLKKNIPEFVVESTGRDAYQEYCEKIRIILSRYDFYSQKARQYVQEKHSLEKYFATWNEVVQRVMQRSA